MSRRSVLVQFQAVPERRSVSERWQDSMNQSSHRCFGNVLRNWVLHRGALLRCRDGRWFIFRQILVIVKKFAPSDLIRIAHLRLRLRTFRFLKDEKRAPRETSGRHSCQ